MFRCGLMSYFGTECRLRTLLNFESEPTTTEPTTSTTLYSTTSTARPPSTSTTAYERDPLRSCNIDGLPASKEKGQREIQELLEYE